MLKSWSLSEIESLDYIRARKIILSRSEEVVFLKIKWTDGATGYSCLQPWPHLGDPHQIQILQSLKSIKEDPKVIPFLDPLVEKGFYFARNFEVLFANLVKNKAWIESLENNLLIDRPQAFTKEMSQYFFNCGYKTLKIKLNLHTLLDLLLKKEILNSFRLRLDFNACLNSSQWQMAQNHLMTFQRLQYIEEPMPYDAILYSRSMFPIALDHEFKKNMLNEKPEFTHLVLKPLKQNLKAHFDYAEKYGLNITLTNSMDFQWTQCMTLAEMSFYSEHILMQDIVVGFQTSPCLVEINGKVQYEPKFFEVGQSSFLELSELEMKIESLKQWLTDLPWVNE